MVRNPFLSFHVTPLRISVLSAILACIILWRVYYLLDVSNGYHLSDLSGKLYCPPSAPEATPLTDVAPGAIDHQPTVAASAPAALRPASLTHLPSVGISTQLSSCPTQKPNLILSALDSAHMLDTVFIYMQSLDIALGKAALAAQLSGTCPPPTTLVKIMMPASSVLKLPPSFLAMERRYQYLQFIPGIPEYSGNIQVKRFEGWAGYINKTQSQYDRVLAVDLDVIFQRSPFSMPLPAGAELMFVAEWRGLKVGQCEYHRGWFEECRSAADGSYMTQRQLSNLWSYDRLCSGSTYGTARAMAVYLATMAEEEQKSGGGCIDQATHIHIYYNGILDEALREKGYGRVWVAAEAESLIGTVGTTPVVRYNEWGEMLTEVGEVMAVVHQFKRHWKLMGMVRARYGWYAEVRGKPREPLAKTVVDEKYPDLDMPRWMLDGVNGTQCEDDASLCSCAIGEGEYACQWNYPGN